MDVVVTIPQPNWVEWLDEGDLAGDDGQPALWDGEAEYGLTFGPRAYVPKIEPGERVYIVAHNKLRGYAPLVEIDTLTADRFGGHPEGFALVRRGGAVAVTINLEIKGFQGWRYRFWNPAVEEPFPDWKQP